MLQAVWRLVKNFIPRIGGGFDRPISETSLAVDRAFMSGSIPLARINETTMRETVEMTATYHDERRDYGKSVLREVDLDPDPISQFERWFREAEASGLIEPGAMVLATATPSGVPSARVVLLRKTDQRGFAFFTNYDSRKGNELADNPRASLVFYWAELERQVRIEGVVERLPDSDSDAYFQSRPRGSRLSAWASPQSSLVPDRETLELGLTEVEARFGDGEIPRPANWGGYRVEPDLIEFWQGRSSRLHDRLRYRRQASGWTIERLAP